MQQQTPRGARQGGYTVEGAEWRDTLYIGDPPPLWQVEKYSLDREPFRLRESECSYRNISSWFFRSKTWGYTIMPASKTALLQAHVSSELNRTIKVFAARQGLSMRELVKAAVIDFLIKEGEISESDKERFAA